ncbi:hypothetical protein BMS3Bbin10_00912 [bacterium BMS3Bbin10]|nr:hypothetical protein BMS3Bbin10_00912 [bacterium BMS3Bbin10]
MSLTISTDSLPNGLTFNALWRIGRTQTFETA